MNHPDDSVDETVQMPALAAPPPRVLIVDDDPLVRERLVAAVVAAGFDARAVAHGATALAAMRKRFAPIVIADLHLPDMDGLTLCRTIRNEAYDSYVYIVLITAQDGEADILAGLEAGADDYLSKRASPAQLIARLRTAQRILTLEHSLRAVIEAKGRLASTDSLTGANNRRYFARHLDREFKRARRFDGELALLLLDIDHFKRINDRWGHGVGDDVLREFAHRIASSLPRACDWYARTGGEEFAVVLPQTGLAGGREVAERLRARVAAEPVATAAATIAITVSIGVSALEALPGLSDASSEALVESADRCLYLAKQGGRDQVSTARHRDRAAAS